MNRQYSASLILTAALTLHAAEPMPPAQQNSVIQKYCGACHSDALMYGGLSVQHFDAAHPEPAVAAMLVSKLTAGHSPEEVNAADSPATILGFMKTGAMGAGGFGVPDEPTQLAFVKALTVEAAGAGQWDSRMTEKPELTATILRQQESLSYDN